MRLSCDLRAASCEQADAPSAHSVFVAELHSECNQECMHQGRCRWTARFIVYDLNIELKFRNNSEYPPNTHLLIYLALMCDAT